MTAKNTVKAIEEGCLNCLLYFGIFKYPLKLHEVHEFNLVKASLHEVEASLESMIAGGSIFRYDEFYLPEDSPDWTEERLKGNARAQKLLAKSRNYLKIIAAFPFVKSIAISGSLSKNYASENPDIDYFIITDANRLWIARTLLHLFKKLTFITGHQHYFCMNYFVDTEAMALAQRNQYAAIELATLLPAYNEKLIDLLMNKNPWFVEFLPNHSGKLNTTYLVPERKRRIKIAVEFLFNHLSLDQLNRRLMKITDRKWRRKWRHQNFTKEEYHQALQTEIHISKNHPDNCEKLVLDSIAGKAPNAGSE